MTKVSGRPDSGNSVKVKNRKYPGVLKGDRSIVLKKELEGPEERQMRTLLSEGMNNQLGNQIKDLDSGRELQEIK